MDQQKTVDEREVPKYLPDKLRAEIHQRSLRHIKKVRIFADWEAGLLVELVLKLQPQVYSPEITFARKGIWAERCISSRKANWPWWLMMGSLSLWYWVMAATLVKSVSLILKVAKLAIEEQPLKALATQIYSVPSKDDLMEALTEYPDAKGMLEEKGSKSWWKMVYWHKHCKCWKWS